AAVGSTPPAHARQEVPADEAESLLARSDVAAHAPSAFRARLRIEQLDAGDDDRAPMEVEVWCSGESKSLVRFLGHDDRGKYLLRLDETLWLLVPGARKPVKIGPSRRLVGGASLDEILGIRYGRDYRIERASTLPGEPADLVALDLAARNDRA